MTFAALGAYALNGVRADLVVLFAIGLLGFVMRRFGYPVAPAVIGLIPGPIAEEQFRRALAISQGDPTALVTSPFAAVTYTVLVIAAVVAVVLRRRSRTMASERGVRI